MIDIHTDTPRYIHKDSDRGGSLLGWFTTIRLLVLGTYV